MGSGSEEEEVEACCCVVDLRDFDVDDNRFDEEIIELLLKPVVVSCVFKRLWVGCVVVVLAD